MLQYKVYIFMFYSDQTGCSSFRSSNLKLICYKSPFPHGIKFGDLQYPKRIFVSLHPTECHAETSLYSDNEFLHCRYQHYEFNFVRTYIYIEIIKWSKTKSTYSRHSHLICIRTHENNSISHQPILRDPSLYCFRGKYSRQFHQNQCNNHSWGSMT